MGGCLGRRRIPSLCKASSCAWAQELGTFHDEQSHEDKGMHQVLVGKTPMDSDDSDDEEQGKLKPEPGVFKWMQKQARGR